MSSWNVTILDWRENFLMTGKRGYPVARGRSSEDVCDSQQKREPKQGRRVCVCVWWAVLVAHATVGCVVRKKWRPLLLKEARVWASRPLPLFGVRAFLFCLFFQTAVSHTASCKHFVLILSPPFASQTGSMPGLHLGKKSLVPPGLAVCFFGAILPPIHTDSTSVLDTSGDNRLDMIGNSRIRLQTFLLSSWSWWVQPGI